MALQVVQVVINDGSNKTITGIYDFDRACGGTLIPPNGSAFPVSSSAGEVFFNNGDEVLYVRNASNTAWISLSPTSSSVTYGNHPALRQLVHLANDGGPYETFTSGSVEDTGPWPFPTASIWYADTLRTKKIVETRVSYNPNKTISTVKQIAYDVDGATVLSTATDTITYQGIFETSRTRVMT